MTINRGEVIMTLSTALGSDHGAVLLADSRAIRQSRFIMTLRFWAGLLRIGITAAFGGAGWPMVSLGQVTIPITNFDFETGGVSDGQFSNSPGVIPTGWSAAGAINGSFYGYFNPNDSSYTGTTGSGTTGTMSGPNVFYFGSAATGQGIEQTLNTAFAIDTDYALTLAVGARNGGGMASVQMDLLAGSTVLATGTFNNSTLDSFDDFQVTYNANPANNGLAGQPLTVRFLEIDNQGGVGTEMDIDNARLTAVPEPSFYAAVTGLGLVVFAAVRRWRRLLQQHR
jgi:hypothetical protein